MKLLQFIALVLACMGAFLFFGHLWSKDKPKRTIVKQVTDERGLTSVMYYENSNPADTFAFDYLTPKEYRKELINTGYVCPDCGEWGCIYEDIDTQSGDGTDSEILRAIEIVCKDRGITDPKIIDLLKANYYL